MPTVAIIGASANRAKFGNRSLRAHRDKGYNVFPVNLKGGTIEGLPVYRSVSEIPVPLDRVSMYVPPEIGMTLLDEIAAKGCGELWLNPGSESDELIDRARELGIEPVVACSLIDVSG
jgi:predicted CoA-binding protein